MQPIRIIRLLTVGTPVLAVVLFMLLSGHTAVAQSNSAQLCASLDSIEQQCSTLSESGCQALLEKCRDFYETQASAYKQTVNQKASEAKSFQNQVAIYSNKISQLNSLINSNQVIIKDLGIQIEDTEGSILETEQDIQDAVGTLAEMLQRLYEEGERSSVEVLLAGDTFATFFENVSALDALQGRNREVLEQVQDLHLYLTDQREKLDTEKDSLERSVVLTQLQREESQQIKVQQQNLLQQTQGEQARYEQYLAEAQSKAAEIRRRIFQLATVPETQAPTLEEAYQLAVHAEQATGVRPAVILGLLTVESAIGKNVGQCNCPTCRYPNIHYKEIMRDNQWPYFAQVTAELGRDPNQTPVSCAIAGGKVQWGGAMGPAQFMPATWALYKDRLAALVGGPPDPWRVRDAFLAAGLYLQDWGAANQSYYTELGAVTAYLCGTSTMTYRCQVAGGEGYRYQVMKNAAEYQGYIDDGVFD